MSFESTSHWISAGQVPSKLCWSRAFSETRARRHSPRAASCAIQAARACPSTGCTISMGSCWMPTAAQALPSLEGAPDGGRPNNAENGSTPGACRGRRSSLWEPLRCRPARTRPLQRLGGVPAGCMHDSTGTPQHTLCAAKAALDARTRVSRRWGVSSGCESGVCKLPASPIRGRQRVPSQSEPSHQRCLPLMWSHGLSAEVPA